MNGRCNVIVNKSLDLLTPSHTGSPHQGGEAVTVSVEYQSVTLNI